MFRRIWTAAILLATALGFATATAGPEGPAIHRPAKDHAARILISLGAGYFATLLLLIFQP